MTLFVHRHDRNVVIEPAVDTAADIELIRNNKAMVVNGRYVVNHRIYGKDGETFYPISGVGLIVLTRAGARALAALQRLGETQQAKNIGDLAFAHLSEAERRVQQALVLRAYRATKAKAG